MRKVVVDLVKVNFSGNVAGRGGGDTALLDEGQRLRQMCKTVCILSGTEY